MLGKHYEAKQHLVEQEGIVDLALVAGADRPSRIPGDAYPCGLRECPASTIQPPKFASLVVIGRILMKALVRHPQNHLESFAGICWPFQALLGVFAQR